MLGIASRVAIIVLDDQLLDLEPAHVELIDVETAELAALDRQATDAKPADREKSDGESADRRGANRQRTDRHCFPGRGWQRLSIVCSLHSCSPWWFAP